MVVVARKQRSNIKFSSRYHDGNEKKAAASKTKGRNGGSSSSNIAEATHEL